MVGLVGLRGGLFAVEKREISCLYQESNPDSLAIQLVAHRKTDETQGVN
jgi:hypothetical protein